MRKDEFVVAKTSSAIRLEFLSEFRTELQDDFAVLVTFFLYNVGIIIILHH